MVEFNHHDRDLYAVLPQPGPAPEDAAWVHFPKLHLLLGWSVDAPAKLGETAFGLRHVMSGYLFRPADLDEVTYLLKDRRRHYAASSVAGDEPVLHFRTFVRSTSVHFVEHFLDEEGRVAKKSFPLERSGRIQVTHDGQAWVRVHFEGSVAQFTVERRMRRMADWAKAKLAEYGLEYAPGVGKRANKPDGLRDPNEQKFARDVSQYKEQFAKRRAEEMRNDASTRPADFAEQVSAQARTCIGEIERGKRDRDGNLKTMPSDEALAERVIMNIARYEATQQLFDYDFVPVYTWSKTTGLVQHI